MNARINDDWIRCGRCGHKLARITKKGKITCSPAIEIKCSSCKTLNMYPYAPKTHGEAPESRF